MDGTQQSMGMGMYGPNVVWWVKNQVAFTFQSALPPTPENKQPIINSLHLTDLNEFLQRNQLSLQSFGEQDIAHPAPEVEGSTSPLDESLGVLGKGLKAAGEGIEKLGETIEDSGEKIIERGEKVGGNGNGADNDLTNPRGKYLFPSPDRSGSTMITFFNIVPTENDPPDDVGVDQTVKVVNLFNNTPVIVTTSGEEIIPPIAMPNWLGGGTPDSTHGCPASPPIPVTAGDQCIASGYCPITLDGLSPTMQERFGDGVTVFVLDTMPTAEQLSNASNLANPPGSGIRMNLLLQDMVTGMQSADTFSGIVLNANAPAINVYHPQFPDYLENENAPRTGRDLYRILYGFKMPDHGLFVAGIIRDLAPNAKIECVRVLNDYGVGRVNDLMQALEIIQGRMIGGDLQGLPVVINLSLVITPESELFGTLGFVLPEQPDGPPDTILREGLHQVIQSLVNSGAVIVASAGNDSNSPEMPGRVGPRYPARFSETVSVASVTKGGVASIFSNMATATPEQPNGIATLGGNVAEPVAPIPPDCMTGATDIAYIIGVYSSDFYPKLSVNDCNDYYSAPNTSAWAYWSGTSFATPIISALAARMIEGLAAGSVPSSQQVVATISSSTVTAASFLPLGSNTDLQALVFPASQCQSVSLEKAPGVGSQAAEVES